MSPQQQSRTRAGHDPHPGGARAGGQGAATGGLQGVGVELLPGRAGAPCPRLVAAVLLGTLLLGTLKVDAVEYL